jgi:ribosomal-protein-alanine N-acetyltransferase
VIETERLFVVPIAPEHARAQLDYYHRNRGHLAPWEPMRDPGFYTLDYQQRAIASTIQDVAEGHSCPFIAFMRDDPERMIAGINIFNIMRGTFSAAFLGYGVDANVQGRGIGTEAVGAVVNYVFAELRLHRVMANYNPVNERSARLLEKLGFEREGYARDYLFLNGAWRDHILTAKINPDPKFRPEAL